MLLIPILRMARGKKADTQQLVPTLHIEHYEETPGSEATSLERGESNPMSQSQMAYS